MPSRITCWLAGWSLVASLVACGGGGDSGPDAALGSPDLLVGTFAIDLVAASDPNPAFTKILGTVYDGETPSPIIWEQADQSGNCVLLTPRVPFCETSCGGSAACVEDGVCQDYPTKQAVGTVHVSGLAVTGGGTSFDLDPIADIYQIPTSIELDYPPFGEGDPVSLHADGSSFTPAFTLAASGGSGQPDADVTTLDHFSFFVTSLESLQALSNSADGFGGDLRYGETGPGAGLRGADKLCAAIAEISMPGASAKGWHAFLSASDDGSGNRVDAVDRIGDGPWYDRVGRLLAPTKADLIQTRPLNGDAAIADDFPNEFGVPNHQPNPNQAEVDNHDTLTGSDDQGRLYAADATCLDWTANAGDKVTEGQPRVGHSWPRSGPGGGLPGDNDMANWMSSLTEAGCAPGVNLIETGGPDPRDNTVGSGGGYGGFYCFADVP